MVCVISSAVEMGAIEFLFRASGARKAVRDVNEYQSTDTALNLHSSVVSQKRASLG